VSEQGAEEWPARDDEGSAAVKTPVHAAQAAERRPPQHTAEQLVRGVGSILMCMATKAPPDTQLTCFHSSYAPKISMQNYIARILRNFMCSNQCLVIALIYIDRLVKSSSAVSVSELSCHRLFITAATLAAKFHDDRFFSNAHYAKVGGLSARELSGLEKRFLYYVNWKLHVQPEEFELYCGLVGQALAGGKEGEPVKAVAAPAAPCKAGERPPSVGSSSALVKSPEEASSYVQRAMA